MQKDSIPFSSLLFECVRSIVSTSGIQSKFPADRLHIPANCTAVCIGSFSETLFWQN